MSKLKPLTIKQFRELKIGNEVVCISTAEHLSELKTNERYIIKSISSSSYSDNIYSNRIRVEGMNYSIYYDRFSLISEIDTLIHRCNKGREYAEQLLDQYSGQIKIENGRYVLK